MVHSNRGDFMQGFHFGRFAREHFLRMLGSMMNDIEHNFVDTVSTERILQWRATIQELISVGFALEFFQMSIKLKINKWCFFPMCLYDMYFLL